MLHRFLPVLVTAMLAGGCASLVDGQNQSVSVLTPDCPGAACRLHNDKGRWHVATTPASVGVNTPKRIPPSNSTGSMKAGVDSLRIVQASSLVKRMVSV